MAKALCWIGIVLSLCVLLIFALDIVFIATSVITAFLGWRTLRSVK